MSAHALLHRAGLYGGHPEVAALLREYGGRQ